MTEQEINYFLDEVTVKQELIESIELLRTELAQAMAPMLEPKYKPISQLKPGKTTTDFDYIVSRKWLTGAEKLVLVWMLQHNTKQRISVIAKGVGMTPKGVRESLRRLYDYGGVRNYHLDWRLPPDGPAFELVHYELNNDLDKL